MIGTVTRVSGARVWVAIASHLPGAEVGPLRAVNGTYSPGDHVLIVEAGDELIVAGVIGG